MPSNTTPLHRSPLQSSFWQCSCSPMLYTGLCLANLHCDHLSCNTLHCQMWIFIMPGCSQTTRFKDHQYLRLYGIATLKWKVIADGRLIPKLIREKSWFLLFRHIDTFLVFRAFMIASPCVVTSAKCMYFGYCAQKPGSAVLYTFWWLCGEAVVPQLE